MFGNRRKDPDFPSKISDVKHNNPECSSTTGYVGKFSWWLQKPPLRFFRAKVGDLFPGRLERWYPVTGSEVWGNIYQNRLYL